MSEFYINCYNNYEKYRSDFQCFSRHSELIKILKKYNGFSIQTAGKSIEGREILSVKLGKGSNRIMAWSQMHGNESTATGALLDILDFFESYGEFDEDRDLMLNNITFMFVPMLNPDGAERWERENAAGIDLNRDALRQVCPESKILQQIFNDFKPHYAFNLHDQDRLYAAAHGKPATISLFAPPCDEYDSMSESRNMAIKAICALNEMLQKYIPGGVGKWDDDFEPRAFGEHFQKAGASTILIESGGYYSDPERNTARRLNFTGLLHLFKLISLNSIAYFPSNNYKLIPLNKKDFFFDILLRNAVIEKSGHRFVCDLGINRNDYDEYLIADIGDLSCRFGYDEFYMKEQLVTPETYISELNKKIGKISDQE